MVSPKSSRRLSIKTKRVQRVTIGQHTFNATRGKCCEPPSVVEPPVLPRTKETCTGKVWDYIKNGRCKDGDRDDWCIEGFTTAVEVKEYELVWNDKAGMCTAKPTGRTAIIPVPTCYGKSCQEEF